MTDFFQSGPELTNTFEQHRWLKSFLKFKMGSAFESVHPILSAFGRKCATDYLDLARTAEREKPELIQFDPWGRRVDQVRLSPAWTHLKAISANEELIKIGYEKAHGELSRLYQFSKLFLFHPSSAFFTCPLAMADGAAKVLESFGTTDFHEKTFQHLTSSNPDEFWTSGQWMTEKTGGSDVSGTSTLAKFEDGQIRLWGTKWFSSSTTSEVALALARYENSPEGSKGLSLFLVPTFWPMGGSSLNQIQILRLKEKLGTWALPTAELSLQGALAFPVGAPGDGVKTISSMLNITRLYNAICSAGTIARGMDLLRDYSKRRIVFGQALDRHPLHIANFARQEIRAMASLVMTLDLVHLLGRAECQTGSSQESEVLRLMTPVCKVFTAKMATQISSEVVEGFGGAGYVEDTGIPALLRDSQVFPIWEGATHVLSLDLLRVVRKRTSLSSWLSFQRDRLHRLNSAEIRDHAKLVENKLLELESALEKIQTMEEPLQIANMRSLTFHLGWLHSIVAAMQWFDSLTGSSQKTAMRWLSLWRAEWPAWQPLSSELWESAREIGRNPLDL